jgi:hypothetical protein
MNYFECFKLNAIFVVNFYLSSLIFYSISYYCGWREAIVVDGEYIPLLLGCAFGGIFIAPLIRLWLDK